MRKSLFALALGGLSIGTTEYVVMGLLPEMARDFNQTIPQTGHLISSYALGVVIGAPLLVAISSNYPPKKVLLFLMSIFVLFNGLSALVPNHHLMFFVRLLSGLPHGAFFGVGSVVASRIASKGKEAQAISVMFAGLTVANLMMVPIGTYIGHHYSWRFTFGLIAILGIITVASIAFWLPDLPVVRKGNLRNELQFFGRTEAWLLILITSIGTGGLFAWISYIAPLLIEVTRFDPSAVPYILALAGVGMLVGNAAGGKLADKFPPIKACIISFTAIGICLAINYFVSSDKVFTTLMTFITGAITFTLATPIQLLMIKTAAEAEMLGASVSQASFNIGNALGAFLGGLPIAAGLGLTSPLLVGILMTLCGVGFTVGLIRLQGRKVI
ncbi:MFS transporter [Desertivirga arenae]|uniref:MFS transporter n=1 Tax=Desertivirga arenae TaxID=2810309 RepID=UPI001A967BF6|nr:MFS transporter [Pedobacter sp. SYSU D00823]